MQKSALFSIFRIQSQRLGYVRTIIGAILMYFSLPLFIFVHISVVLFLYKVIFVSLIGVKNIRFSDYLILDRYNISELPIFDRLNCLFCEYANGIILLLNKEIDQIADTPILSRTKSFLTTVLILPVTILFVLGILLTTIPTNIFMKLLGLHRGSHKHVQRELAEVGYADLQLKYVKKHLLLYKVAAKVISYNLEQIESAWCPIKHLQKEGYVFPEHHKNFIERGALLVLEKELKQSGSVSNNKPKF